MEVRFRLPQERCYIVIHRTASAALEINKVWHFFTTALNYHYISALEVTVHERTHLLLLQQDIRHTLKVILKTVFLELQTCSLQKTVLEIIQIPADASQIELGLRIAHIEVKILCTFYLKTRQGTDCLAQHCLLALAEHTRLPAFTYVVK